MYRYNAIPLDIIGEKVLEIGLNEQALLASKIGDKVLANEYLGIDIINRGNKILPWIESDILTFNIKEKYDTIIMLEVFEHIIFEKWDFLFNKLKNALNKNGHLIISVPYKEKKQHYSRNRDLYQVHKVFNINKKLLTFYLPGAKIRTLRYLRLRNDNEGILWSVGRLIKRLLFGTDLQLYHSSYFLIWKKVVKEEVDNNG